MSFRPQEIFQAMIHFQRVNFDDSQLPLTSEDLKSQIFCDSDYYREPWSAFRAKDFCGSQWNFIAPVFDHAPSSYILHPKSVLPFTSATGHLAPKGSGNFGNVYEVIIHPAHLEGIVSAGDREAGARVAVKKLHRPEVQDEAQVQELEKEWKKEIQAHEELTTCGHPNIIKFIAGITRAQDRYLVCEWASGGNLREFWTKNNSRPLTRTMVKDVICQIQGIAGALKVIHDRKYRHGDLKPENIVRLKTPSRNSVSSQVDVGHLKILDMGLTKYHSMATRFRNLATTTKYATWRYEPPEASNKDQPWSRRYDIWSAGCVILEFIIWLLEGPKGLKDFNDKIVDEFRKECHYFELKKENGQTTSKVHTAVEHKMKSLSSHPWCEQSKTALGDLLKLVRDRLLVVTLDAPASVKGKIPHDRTRVQVRADSSTLKAELDEIVRRGKMNQAYWLKGKTFENVPNLHPETAVTPAASESHVENAKGLVTTERSSPIVPLLTGSLRVG
ncbi:uncharacterized protein JN550_001669 [Neoarthrinium moseri]|uniref:uncharacterized protein n=1 Tax=Neoarthrinium moseri TaxID=1658444 RepID=UPI001FDC673C|nr:uncharacterized protein JN550_001669 [Neoarthrinium moseri]KAI1876173.1 hypothetical protein JN550_001669 [Neoarthrinium moseri]